MPKITISDVLGALGLGLQVYGSVKGGKAAEKAAELRAAVTRRTGELDKIFATLNLAELNTYTEALKTVYGRREDLYTQRLLNAENKQLEAQTRLETRHSWDHSNSGPAWYS